MSLVLNLSCWYLGDWLIEFKVAPLLILEHLAAVRVKGGMSLRNFMWHGLRNDIIMRNLIYGK